MFLNILEHLSINICIYFVKIYIYAQAKWKALRIKLLTKSWTRGTTDWVSEPTPTWIEMCCMQLLEARKMRVVALTMYCRYVVTVSISDKYIGCYTELWRYNRNQRISFRLRSGYVNRKAGYYRSDRECFTSDTTTIWLNAF